MTLLPPFAYFGGKTTLAPRIAELLPDHDHYVEPFAGSLAVLLAKRPTAWETVNDLDGDLMAFWCVLRDQPRELARACSLTPHGRAELAAAGDLDVPDIERARRVWVRLTQSRTSLGARALDWKYGQHFGAHPNRMSVPDTLTAYVARMEAAARRLHNVSLECRDAFDVIRDYGQHQGVCIYADPPYLGSTRKGSSRYRHELPGHERHQQLADALRSCKASVVLSGYASPLYEELFDGWHQTAMKGPPTTAGDTDRVEVLWSNRPLGGNTLFDLGEVVS